MSTPKHIIDEMKKLGVNPPEPLTPEPPTARPGRVFGIVHEGDESAWGLHRLPELEAAYEAQFKRKIPYGRKGQGSGVGGWNHENNADFSDDPDTPEGQFIMDWFRANNLPFRAATVDGVHKNAEGRTISTGKHIHGGPASGRKRTAPSAPSAPPPAVAKEISLLTGAPQVAEPPVVAPQAGGTVAQRNNNPGALRPVGGTGYRTFNTPEEGMQATVSDLTAKMTGKTRTGLSGNSTVRDLFKVWAPTGDGNNDPEVYARNVAKMLGVTVDTPIGSLLPRVKEVAEAIAQQEGFYAGKPAASPKASASSAPPAPVAAELARITGTETAPSPSPKVASPDGAVTGQSRRREPSAEEIARRRQLVAERRRRIEQRRPQRQLTPEERVAARTARLTGLPAGVLIAGLTAQNEERVRKAQEFARSQGFTPRVDKPIDFSRERGMRFSNEGDLARGAKQIAAQPARVGLMGRFKPSPEADNLRETLRTSLRPVVEQDLRSKVSDDYHVGLEASGQMPQAVEQEVERRLSSLLPQGLTPEQIKKLPVDEGLLKDLRSMRNRLTGDRTRALARGAVGGTAGLNESLANVLTPLTWVEKAWDSVAGGGQGPFGYLQEDLRNRAELQRNAILRDALEQQETGGIGIGDMIGEGGVQAIYKLAELATIGKGLRSAGLPASPQALMSVSSGISAADKGARETAEALGEGYVRGKALGLTDNYGKGVNAALQGSAGALESLIRTGDVKQAVTEGVIQGGMGVMQGRGTRRLSEDVLRAGGFEPTTIRTEDGVATVYTHPTKKVFFARKESNIRPDVPVTDVAPEIFERLTKGGKLGQFTEGRINVDILPQRPADTEAAGLNAPAPRELASPPRQIAGRQEPLAETPFPAPELPPNVPKVVEPAPVVERAPQAEITPLVTTAKLSQDVASRPAVNQGQYADSISPKTVIRHADPRIDGGEVIRKLPGGKLEVANNEGGVSVVKNPRTSGNRNATIARADVTQNQTQQIESQNTEAQQSNAPMAAQAKPESMVATPSRVAEVVAPSVPPSVAPTEIENHNLEQLNGQKFSKVLMNESIGGNAGRGRAAVNAAVDNDGQIVEVGNIQNLSKDVQGKLRAGEYKNVTFVVKALEDGSIERWVGGKDLSPTAKQAIDAAVQRANGVPVSQPPSPRTVPAAKENELTAPEAPPAKGEHGHLIQGLFRSPGSTPEGDTIPPFLAQPSVRVALGLSSRFPSPDRDIRGYNAALKETKERLAPALGKPRASHITPEELRAWAEEKGLPASAIQSLDYAVSHHAETKIKREKAQGEVQARVQQTKERLEKPKAPTQFQQTGIRGVNLDPSIHSLSEAARRIGLDPDKDRAFRGELGRLSNKETGSTGIVRKGGVAPDELAQRLTDEGYFTERPDPNQMLSMIEEDLRGTRKHYSSAHEVDIEKEYYDQLPQEAKDEFAREMSLLRDERVVKSLEEVRNGQEDEGLRQFLYEIADEHGVSESAVNGWLEYERGVFESQPQRTRQDKLSASDEAGFINIKSLLIDKRETPILEIITSLRRAGLLSAVKMHARNLTSNTTFAITEEAARPFAALADKLVSLKTGYRTKQGASPISVARGVLSREGALIKGTSDAWKQIMHGTARDTSDKAELSKMRSGLPILDAYVEFVMRSVEASDKWAKAYALRRELDSLAITEARNEHKLDPKVNVSERAKELRKNPTTQMQEDAVAYAEIASFQDSNVLSEAFSAFKRVIGDPDMVRRIPGAGKYADSIARLGRGTRFIIDQAIPFTRTPSNVFMRLLEHTPIGIPISVYKYKQIGKGAKRRELVEKEGKLREKYDRRLSGVRSREDRRLANSREKEVERLQEGFNRLVESMEQKNGTTGLSIEEYKAIDKARRGLDALISTVNRTAIEEDAKIKRARGFADKQIEDARKAADSMADERFTKEEQRRFAETFGRAGLGNILGALALVLMMKGVLEIGGNIEYEDEKARAIEGRDAGVRPGSMRVPFTKKRIQITGNPLGNALVAVATGYEQALRPGSAYEKTKASLKGMKDIAKQSPMLQQTLDNDKDHRSVEERLANYVSSFIPRVVGEVGEVVDTQPRKYWGKGVKAQFQRFLPPGVLPPDWRMDRGSLPVVENPWGGQSERGDVARRLLRAFDPLELTTQSKDTPRPTASLSRKYGDESLRSTLGILRGRARKGENIVPELDRMVREGQISQASAAKVWASRSKDAVVEHFKGLKLEKAEEEFKDATPEEKRILEPLLIKKRAGKSRQMREGFRPGASPR